MASNDALTTGMAGRYASALFELANEAGSLDRVASDLDGFAGLLDESEDLQRLVRSPVFSAEDQEKAVSAVLAKAGVDALTANFFKLVATNRRLFSVPDMIKAFRALLAQHRGEVSADVTSAVPLDDAQMTSLKATLKETMGQDVQMNTMVDPSILGGLIVKVGSRMVDSSLKTKLNNLKVAMKEVG
ncbi:MAG: F0F1 ATP synthase subunit delta [Hyphomicrobiaceae bacterium]